LGIGLGLRPPPERICPGVSCVGIGVGGATLPEARQALSERLLPALDRPVPLVDGSRSRESTARRLGCDFDVDAIARAAFAVGRQGS
jgi:hypothetical protein